MMGTQDQQQANERPKTGTHLGGVDADGDSHAVGLLALDALDVDHPLLAVHLHNHVRKRMHGVREGLIDVCNARRITHRDAPTVRSRHLQLAASHSSPQTSSRSPHGRLEHHPTEHVTHGRRPPNSIAGGTFHPSFGTHVAVMPRAEIRCATIARPYSPSVTPPQPCSRHALVSDLLASGATRCTDAQHDHHTVRCIYLSDLAGLTLEGAAGDHHLILTADRDGAARV